MNNFNQKHGGGQSQGGSQDGKPGQGGKPLPGEYQQGQNTQGSYDQGGPGAWVWLRWNEGAPENAIQDFGNPEMKSWHCQSGDWNCKLWIPSKDQTEAENFVNTKIRNNKWVKDTKFEWNWNQRAA